MRPPQGLPEAGVPMHLDGAAAAAMDKGSKVYSSPASVSGGGKPAAASFAYAASERSQIRETWATLMRWSKRTRQQENINPLESTTKVQFGRVD